MAVQTIAEAEAELTLWYQARAKASKGQSFSMAGRTMTYQDIETINDMIAKLERRIAAGSSRRHSFAVANFNT